MNTMQRRRNTKIIATLGPHSASRDIIESLFLAGVDAFRLNFSHGNHQEHAQKIEHIRSIEQKHDFPIAIIADLQGPKIRIGMFEHGSIVLKKDDEFCLDKNKRPGTKERVYLPHDAVFNTLQKGDHILLDDGKIKLLITETGSDFILTRVKRGGKLSSKKGVNLPDSKIPIPALTEKDKQDITFCLTQDIDFIALSFIQNTQDIIDARALIGDHAKIISKIEKPQALHNIDEIIAHSDSILLARGDLGVEVNLYNVPMIQKDIIQRCRAMGRPVAIATQMLESMIHHPTPTRAEVSDVANAVYDGADAVMLSAETAAGDFPLESVLMMDTILHHAEQDHKTLVKNYALTDNLYPLTHAVSTIARQKQAKAIVSFSICGTSTMHIARQRPMCPIVAVVTEQKTTRILALVWGIRAFAQGKFFSFQHIIDTASILCQRHEITTKGDTIIISACAPSNVPSEDNMLYVLKIDT